MAIYPAKVVDANGNPLFKLAGFVIAALIIVILLFNCLTRVDTGRVGVLTLFGRVDPQVLTEGIHLVNPLKTNNPMSIQTQTIKESASVPSSEGLVMNLRHLAHLPHQSRQGGRGLPEDRRQL